jgi:aminopeptidase
MDRFIGSYDKSLVRAARAAVDEVLAVKKDERVLLISNPGKEVREISMAIFDACLDVNAAPSLMFQREKGQFDLAEEEVVKAMSAQPQVLISMSRDRLGKDRWGMRNGYNGKRRYDHIFDLLYEEKKSRAFWSPGTTRDMFRRTVPIDYAKLRSDCSRVDRALARARSVRVTAPGGTNVTIGIRGRRARRDDGNFSKPGQAGNLPSGEVFISPALGTMNGTIAFDGSIVLHEDEIVINRPIMTEVRGGFITGISGGMEAIKLEKSVRMGERKALEAGKRGELRASLVQKYARNARSIGELGIGLNRKAKITANMLEDEKVYGTCHFAVGSNYDGDAEALIHLDGLVKRPTIALIDSSGKERALMAGGKLTWD